MVVIVRIEQTNKQTTRQINRQINKQKLNYGIYWQNSLNLRSNVLARFSHRSLGMSKEKQCWQYLTICISLVLNSIMKNRFITKSIDCKSDLVSGQASKPYRITNYKSCSTDWPCVLWEHRCWLPQRWRPWSVPDLAHAASTEGVRWSPCRRRSPTQRWWTHRLRSFPTWRRGRSTAWRLGRGHLCPRSSPSQKRSLSTRYSIIIIINIICIWLHSISRQKKITNCGTSVLYWCTPISVMELHPVVSISCRVALLNLFLA